MTPLRKKISEVMYNFYLEDFLLTMNFSNYYKIKVRLKRGNLWNYLVWNVKLKKIHYNNGYKSIFITQHETKNLLIEIFHVFVHMLLIKFCVVPMIADAFIAQPRKTVPICIKHRHHCVLFIQHCCRRYHLFFRIRSIKLR